MKRSIALSTLLLGVATHTLSSDRPTPEALRQRDALRAAFPATLVFDSNRGGTFGIYRMESDGSGLRRVIDGPRHEMAPSPSPDGHWITYAVADTLERGAPRETHLCRLDGSEDRLVLSDANYPSFTPDGKALIVERGRESVWTVPLDGGEARLLYRPAGDLLEGATLVKPELSPNGEWLAFTADKPRPWYSWAVHLPSGFARRIGKGCEPVWHPSGTAGYFISSKDTRERTGIWYYDGITGEYTVIQDADAPRGHEYFPWISADAGILLWGACRAGEHAHETANYQLYGRRLPDGKPVRLTFDRFTNRWPRAVPRRERN